MCRPVWQVMSPSRINFPISFSSVCAVCELISIRFWFRFGLSLFVVGDDGFEKIAEALVAQRGILARHLQQQLLERIETSQRMARDGVSQPCAQHHELLLTLAFRCADRAAHCIVETPQLAFGPGVHVAPAAYHSVRLVVEIHRIRDQFLDIHVGRAFEPASIAPTPSLIATVASATAFTTFAMWSPSAFAW